MGSYSDMLKLQANMLAKTAQSAKSQFVDKGWLVNSEDGFTVSSCYLGLFKNSKVWSKNWSTNTRALKVISK